jgi:hypothetical protein
MRRVAFPCAAILLTSAVSTPVRAEAITYNPTFNSENFSNPVPNKYFTVTPGARFTYEGATPDGPTRIEIEVTGETKEILGIQTTTWSQTFLKPYGVVLLSASAWATGVTMIASMFFEKI